IVLSLILTGLPWTWPAEYSAPIKVLIAGVPRGQRILEPTSLIWSSRYGLHASISPCLGALLFGGLHFTMLVIKTWLLSSPTEASNSVRSLPAAPTNGRPS